MNDFYVYQLLRPWNNVPCYVGKGRGRRCDDHAKLGTRHANKHLASIFKKAGGPLPIVIVAENLSEDEAFALEIKLIAEIGRKDQGKGPLANWTDGGDGVRGYIFTQEARENVGVASRETWACAERRKRVSDTAKTRCDNEAMKAKTSEISKRNWADPAKATIMRSAFRGRKHTPESREKMGLHAKGKPVSDDVREKLRAANLGQKRSAETREKMRIASAARWAKTKNLKKEQDDGAL